MKSFTTSVGDISTVRWAEAIASMRSEGVNIDDEDDEEALESLGEFSERWECGGDNRFNCFAICGSTHRGMLLTLKNAILRLVFDAFHAFFLFPRRSPQ